MVLRGSAIVIADDRTYKNANKQIYNKAPKQERWVCFERSYNCPNVQSGAQV